MTSDVLQDTLVHLIDLALIGKQAHWNVYGKNFMPLHLQLDELVELANSSADTVAERLVAIGGHPDGRSSTVTRTSLFSEFQPGALSDTFVVTAIVEILNTLNKSLINGIRTIGNFDPVSQNILINLAEYFGKTAWMFQAQE